MMHMKNIFTFLSNLMLSSRTPLLITDFKEMRYISPATYPSDNFPVYDEAEANDTSAIPPSRCSFSNDRFVKNKPGGIFLEYYDNKNIRIGYIRYYITTGQIGLFFINDEYQRRGLGKQILSKVIEDLKTNNCDEVWAVTSTNHPFWSNVYNKSFVYRNPAHPSVGGDGYFMKL